MKNIRSYQEHISEALDPNFVMKSPAKDSLEEPKDYLMNIDGDVFHEKTLMGGARRYQRNDFYAIKKYNTDFSRADFRDVDMQRSFFKSCNFNQCNFSGANLYGSRFEKCSFIDALGIDSLEGAQFNNCVF